MEFNNQEALNEYLERVYVEPCVALYEMLSDHAKDVTDFWNVIVPNWRKYAAYGSLTAAVAAFGYSVVQSQPVVAQSNLETTTIPTATRTPRSTATQVENPHCISFSADINPDTAFVTWVLEAEGRGGWILLSDSAVVDQGRVSTGALAYTYQANFGASYDLDVLFDGEQQPEDCGSYSVPPASTATATPTNVVTLQPWKSSTPTETTTPDLTATATFATPVFITLVPTKTSTSTLAPTPTETTSPAPENNLYIPFAAGGR